MLHREDKWWKNWENHSAYHEWKEPFQNGIGTYVVQFLLLFVNGIVDKVFNVNNPNEKINKNN